MRPILTAVTLLLALALSDRSAADAACNVFVAPDGPIGSGSGADPASAKSLAGANSAAVAGDQVCLLDGVYVASTNPAIQPISSGSSGSPIVFRAARGSVPVITFNSPGSNTNTCFHTGQQSYIEFRGIVCSGGDRSGGPVANYLVLRGAELKGGAHNVVEDCRFVNIGGSPVLYNDVAINIENSDYNVVRGNEIVHVRDGIQFNGNARFNLIEKNQFLRIRHIALGFHNTGIAGEMIGNFVQDNRFENPWLSTIDLPGESPRQRNANGSAKRNPAQRDPARVYPAFFRAGLQRQ